MRSLFCVFGFLRVQLVRFPYILVCLVFPLPHDVLCGRLSGAVPMLVCLMCGVCVCVGEG